MSEKEIIAIDLDRVLGPYRSAIFKSTKPYDGAIEAIARIKQKYDLHIITARHPLFKRNTKRWIKKFFPNTFRGIDFVHYKTPIGPMGLKSEICKRIGARVILDDKMSNALDCAGHGIKVYLFGLHNLHRRENLPDGITWVKDWSVVLKELI